MNFQEKLVEASSDLRARAATLTHAAFDIARSRVGVAAKRVDGLKGSLATLSIAGQTLNKVAKRHASRLMKENAAIAVAAGKEFGALARSTYATLAGRKAAAKPARKSRATRKRAASKAA